MGKGGAAFLLRLGMLPLQKALSIARAYSCFGASVTQ